MDPVAEEELGTVPCLLTWCRPDDARFWNATTPNCKGCPHILGKYRCSCPHHEGVDPDEVFQTWKSEQVRNDLKRRGTRKVRVCRK